MNPAIIHFFNRVSELCRAGQGHNWQMHPAQQCSTDSVYSNSPRSHPGTTGPSCTEKERNHFEFLILSRNMKGHLSHSRIAAKATKVKHPVHNSRGGCGTGQTSLPNLRSITLEKRKAVSRKWAGISFFFYE